MSLIERFVVGVDIQGFSSRVARRQVMLERDLDRMLDEAAEEARVSRALWERSVAGDGEVAVLPAEVDMLAVVRKFVSELDHRLTDHNEDHHPETRIRLRVAMHIDVITPAALGYAGPALIVLQRLLDSAPLRTALTDAPDASLAQIISECLYQKTVVPELGGLRPRQFQKVQVDLSAKGFQQTAYVYVPGGLPAPATDRPRKPVRPPVERSGFPLPVPARTATRRERHLADIPSATAVESPHPAAEPRPLSLAVQELVRELWQALEKRDIYHADLLTTLALLEMAGRRRNGWLRDSHGRDLPGELFTEVDEGSLRVPGVLEPSAGASPGLC